MPRASGSMPVGRWSETARAPGPPHELENALPRWAILRAEGQSEAFTYGVYREVEGTEDEALAVMRGLIDTFDEARTERKRKRQTRQVFRLSERTYFVRVQYPWGSNTSAQFTLAELIADTSSDDLPDIVGG
ncbi:hypothetical protein ABT275_44710 [Streptomyces sp. NPDC001185]|uniref:hypothetical protein n=1 Tax=Streptomyces sp. NPDC001185 TaxID=3154380 RepID=UPI00332D2237